MKLTEFTDKAWSLIYPMELYCVVCGNYIDSTRKYCLCDHCIRHIEWGNIEIDSKNRPDYIGNSGDADSLRACMKYGLYSRRLIFELKYNGHSYVARILGQIMADRVLSDPLAEELLNCDVVTGVPVSQSKLKKRGFNQAEKIAKYFCAEIGMKHVPDLLRRLKETEAQRSLSPAERSMNLMGAFGINEKKAVNIKGKRILLIDDIYTTGATINHCARVLKETGAAEVHVLVLATGSKQAVGFFDDECGGDFPDLPEEHEKKLAHLSR